MANIYDQHRAAFANVAAYVVMKDGERLATIAFKFPRDGAGRLYAYVHWLGAPMVRGFAGGYGYDKRSAACANAMRKGTAEIEAALAERTGFEAHAHYPAFRDALSADNGQYWDFNVMQAGFTVIQAV